MTEEPTPLPPLSQVRFTSKIDYITLDGVVRKDIGALDGREHWPAKFHNRRLTVHDASAKDIATLAKSYEWAVIAELEIAIDLKPAGAMDEVEYIQAIHKLKADYLAKRLRPAINSALWSGFRGTYKRLEHGYRLCPFNKRVPGADEQQLYGRRFDGVQVKVYHKRFDNKQPLHWKANSARVEVRLGREGLAHHGLESASDLLAFDLRKQLSPYFRAVRGTRRRVAKRIAMRAPLLKVLKVRQESDDIRHWGQVGIGAFERGGARHGDGLRFLRDHDLNGRFGQALHRLGASLASAKFVSLPPSESAKSPLPTRHYGDLDVAAMTY